MPRHPCLDLGLRSGLGSGMKIAFKKASSGSWLDRMIAWWTNGPYSHCEIVFSSDGAIDGVPPGLVRGGYGSLCYSSYPTDGGVRFKGIVLDPKIWDVFDVPCDRYQEYIASRIALKHVGEHYDWSGILGFVFTDIPGLPQDKFCSEICTIILQSCGLVGNLNPTRTSPNSLARAMGFLTS